MGPVSDRTATFENRFLLYRIRLLREYRPPADVLPSMSRDSEFSELVREWYDPLYRFAFSLSGKRDDALDLTQNAFLKWARKGGTLRKRNKAKSWLFTVVYREFLDQARRSNRFPNLELKEEILPDPDSGDSKTSIDSGSAVAALAQLEEHYRAPLALFYFEHHSYAEIAEVLDVPIGTVMSRIRRGKDRLRNMLEGRGQNNPKVVPFSGKQAQS